MQIPGGAHDETLVFVFGALRSGTTVFRLMLDAHPELNNPGEVDFLFDYLSRDPQHSSGWRYDTDKLAENRVFRASGLKIPEACDGLDLLRDFLAQYRSRGKSHLTLNIHRHLGRALEVLPESRVIHLLRDPRDVSRSCIGMGWAGTLYHGVGQWCTTEEEWRRICDDLAPERYIEVKFEDLIAKTEDDLRRVCAFVGVTFDADMLSYHENTTYNAPDPSLIEQWKRKSSQRDVALVEGRVGERLRAGGYEPSGEPVYPGTLERTWLRIQNRTGVWKTAIRRYGFVLLFMEKLSRRLGLEKMHTRYRNRMRAHDAETLK